MSSLVGEFALTTWYLWEVFATSEGWILSTEENSKNGDCSEINPVARAKHIVSRLQISKLRKTSLKSVAKYDLEDYGVADGGDDNYNDRAKVLRLVY